MHALSIFTSECGANGDDFKFQYSASDDDGDNDDELLDDLFPKKLCVVLCIGLRMHLNAPQSTKIS